MKNTRNRILTAALLGMVTLAALGIIRHVRSEKHLDELVKGGLQGMASSGGGMSKEEIAAFEERSRAFNALWIARHERDVTPEIIPYLEDPIANLRERAAKALAHLESPAAEEPLEKLKRKTDEAKAKGVDYNKHGGAFPVLVDMALERVRSRRLQGISRLQSVASGAGLSWSGVTRLSQKLKQRMYPTQEPINAGDEVMRQIVDTLYVMGKKGEDIQPFVRQLDLSPAQAVRLKGAALPLDKEIDVLLEYLSGPVISTWENYDLAKKHFVGLGPRAATKLKQHLERAKVPLKGSVLVIDAVLVIHDPSFLPVIEKFEHDPAPEVCHRASQVKARLEADSRYPWSAPQMP